MKSISFLLHYHTFPGQQVRLAYSIDGGEITRAVLTDGGDDLWTITIQAADDAKHIRHAYIITDEQGHTLRTEPNSWRIFYFNHRSSVYFADAWADHTLDEMYHRSAFAQSIMLPRSGSKLHMEHQSAPCLLLLNTIPAPEGLRWAVVGDREHWGEWNPNKARLLYRTDTYEWALPVSRQDFTDGVNYKYILVNPNDPTQVVWEEGNNRTLPDIPAEVSASVIRMDAAPRMNCARFRGAGSVIPVFSLRSEGSFGVGDFGDLDLYVCWAADTGQRAVQLLPINDTTRSGTRQDSYPYSGISVFALHPVYLDPREWKNSKAYAEHREEGKRINAEPELDYEEAFRLKMAFAHSLYKEIGRDTLASTAFKQFYTAQREWLRPYTCFCALRDLNGTANFRDWPEEQRVYRELPAALEADAEKLCSFYAFVQFLLHRQMLRVHEHARELGVILKGDIPIGISRDSVPAWVDTRLFHFDGQAGAPPDAFAVNGQNWGFPTYDWELMAQDDYLWWRSRLAHMQQYFDAYRIDHVLGFFRIWEIPSTQIYGLSGYFRPALPYTAEEIRSRGFTADIERLSYPYIPYQKVRQIIHDTGNERFAELYLERTDDSVYTLKVPFRSQRETARLVKDEAARKILWDLATEVLFIRDPEHPETFHPRIAGQLTTAFQTLSEQDRNIFNGLHDHFFYVRHNDFWAEEAMKKIPAVTGCADSLNPKLTLYPLHGNGMLPCAEDLGMVPTSVKGVLDRLHILSLEIQRMPKEYGVRFGNPATYPYMSVATIATHDMPPLRLWWKEDCGQTQDFWHQALGQQGEAPEEASPEICEKVLIQHLQAPSMLCLPALQDWLAISPELRSTHPEKEQINVPANANHYWRYRMHITLEQLIQASGFNEKIRGLIAAAGR